MNITNDGSKGTNPLKDSVIAFQLPKFDFTPNSIPFDAANECSLSKRYSLLKWNFVNSLFQQHIVSHSNCSSFIPLLLR